MDIAAIVARMERSRNRDRCFGIVLRSVAASNGIGPGQGMAQVIAARAFAHPGGGSPGGPFCATHGCKNKKR
jgi:hypothetical protein